MTSKPVFVDTWAYAALLNKKDPWHEKAVVVCKRLDEDARLYVTTQWVLTEFLSTAAKPPFRTRAAEYVRKQFATSTTQVIQASHNDWLRALELYEARADKEWSLVDCMSILACQDRDIDEVFSGDRHFEQAGLKVLLN